MVAQVVLVLLLALPGGKVHRYVETAPTVQACVDRGRASQRVIEAWVRDEKLPIENLVFRQICFPFTRISNEI